MRDIVEPLRVGAIGVLGFITQMTTLDLFFKVSIGFLTCCYLTFKLVKMFRDWNKKDNE